MRKLFILAMVLTGLAGYSQAQAPSSRKLETITQKSAYNNGYKTYDLDAKSSRSTPPVPNGNTAIYHGNVEPVYSSPRGKEYILVTSKKTGNVYKKYIK